VWNADVEPVGSLVDVWVQIKGMPPKWVDWVSIKEMASSLGLMVEVGWQTLLKRIPKERIFLQKEAIPDLLQS